MSIPKRLSADRKLISHFDKCISKLPQEKIGEYNRTLDISAFGDLSELDDPPTVFTVKPLRVDHESFIDVQTDGYGNMTWGDTNYWAIFRAHVIEITDIELKTKDGYIDKSIREIIPPDIIRDIAQKVISLANKGDEVFHTPPVGFMEFYQTLRLRDA
jgi:hypothetical protein